MRKDFDIPDLNLAHASFIEFQTQQPEQSTPAAEDDHPELLNEVSKTFIELIDLTAVVRRRKSQLLALISSPYPRSPTLEKISAAASRAAAIHQVSLRAVGLSGALESKDGFQASLQQAEFAVRIARTVQGQNGRSAWDDLHEYRLFHAVPWDATGVGSIHSGVASLLSEKRLPLAATLLAYLDRENDVSETSKDLNIHRTTLYYRIERAIELLGEEPKGRARFAIHAALRLAVLSGLLPPTTDRTRSIA